MREPQTKVKPVPVVRTSDDRSKLISFTPLRVVMVTFEDGRGERHSAITFVVPDGEAYVVPALEKASSIDWAEKAVPFTPALNAQIVARVMELDGAAAAPPPAPAADAVDVMGAG